MSRSGGSPSLQWSARIASVASLVIASLSSSFAVHAQPAGQTIEGVFINANSAPDWTLSGSRMGSIAMTPSVDGSGWLRLTPVTAFALGRVQANAKIPSGVPIHLEFDYLQWGGRFDGLSIYFADASVASAGRGGVEGGGLGYCGMTGAYLGIGFDDGGNFTAAGCAVKKGFSGGTPNVGMANVVGLRGPQSSNYDYLGRFELKDLQNLCVTNCTSRGQAMSGLRHVVLDMTPRTPTSSGYTLSMTVNGQKVLDVGYPFAPPRELVMGLSATTGAYAANHEVRNILASVQGAVIPTPNCLDRADANGKCLPVDNVLKTWSIYSNVGSYLGLPAPAELKDGNLPQTGWTGATPWAAQNAALAARRCMQLAPTTLKAAPGSPVNRIAVVSRQDDEARAVEPTETMDFTRRGAVDFQLAYSTDHAATWRDAPGGNVTGNNKVLRIFSLPKTELLTNISLLVCKTADGATSPLTEILAWEKK